MADVEKEREAFLIKIGQVEPVAKPESKPTAKKDEE